MCLACQVEHIHTNWCTIGFDKNDIELSVEFYFLLWKNYGFEFYVRLSEMV